MSTVIALISAKEDKYEESCKANSSSLRFLRSFTTPIDDPFRILTSFDFLECVLEVEQVDESISKFPIQTYMYITSMNALFSVCRNISLDFVFTLVVFGCKQRPRGIRASW